MIKQQRFRYRFIIYLFERLNNNYKPIYYFYHQLIDEFYIKPNNNNNNNNNNNINKQTKINYHKKNLK